MKPVAAQPDGVEDELLAACEHGVFGIAENPEAKECLGLNEVFTKKKDILQSSRLCRPSPTDGMFQLSFLCISFQILL